MKHFKVFLSSALGAGIGSLIALEINLYFWWVNLLIGVTAGGLIGYLSYEFKKVRQAIPKAWEMAVEKWPDKKWWKKYFKALTASGEMMIHWGVLFLGFFCISALLDASLLGRDVKILDESPILIEISWLFLASIPFLALVFQTLEEKELIKIIKIANPFRIYLKEVPKYLLLAIGISIWGIICGIYKFVTAIPEILSKGWGLLKLIKNFIVNLFILIHSEIRLLCGVDAFIGAGIGFLAGSALIGFFAGGALGVLNYELVSNRWLKKQIEEFKLKRVEVNNNE